MRDWSGSTIQREALTVPCAYCRSAIGVLCVGLDGKTLEAFPAHTVRSAAARDVGVKAKEAS